MYNLNFSLDLFFKENRLSLERRQFQYSKHIPERRSGSERRQSIRLFKKYFIAEDSQAEFSPINAFC